MSGPTLYKVSEAVGPLGRAPIVKQSIDIREVVVDFSAWLAAGETLAQLSGFAIQASPTASYPSWQTDFPFTLPSGAVPADTTPLILFGAQVLSATQAQLEIANGTPGLVYMLSFLATVAPGQRMKEIDLLVSINQPVNSAMISSITPPAMSVTVVSATTALAAGTTGSVNISNAAAAPITITLPPTPVLDQAINAKDVAGNAATYNITFQGASGALIDGAATFVFKDNREAAQFKWTGAQWSVA